MCDSFCFFRGSMFDCAWFFQERPATRRNSGDMIVMRSRAPRDNRKLLIFEFSFKIFGNEHVNCLVMVRYLLDSGSKGLRDMWQIGFHNFFHEGWAQPSQYHWGLSSNLTMPLRTEDFVFFLYILYIFNIKCI